MHIFVFLKLRGKLLSAAVSSVRSSSLAGFSPPPAAGFTSFQLTLLELPKLGTSTFYLDWKQNKPFPQVKPAWVSSERSDCELLTESQIWSPELKLSGQHCQPHG